MPVVDGEFIPRAPLSLAESHVDFTAHDFHVVKQRASVENRCLPLARRLALLAVELHGVPPDRAITALADTLKDSLARTGRFGYTEAVSEIESLRGGRHAARAEWVVPDAGRYAHLAAKGLTGLAMLIAQRSLETARAVSAAASAAALSANLTGDALTQATAAATKTLHLHVLELIGETLNVGRTAGAMSLPQIPEYAMRSEQLDKNTCAPCDEIHGTIVQVATPQYFAVLPPSVCLGGGRCRGIMVFGDGPRDVRQPAIDIAA